jgi:ribosomal-protein-alanine N-acetyltransferase
MLHSPSRFFRPGDLAKSGSMLQVRIRDNPEVLRLREPEEADHIELGSWFSTAEELRRFAGPDVAWPLAREQLAQWRDDPRIRAWAAEDDASPSELQGYVQIVHAEAGVGRLARVAVAPAARGRGRGRVLIGAVTEQARAMGLVRLELNVYIDNEPARRLYQSVGFLDVDAAPDDPQIIRMALELHRTTTADAATPT